MNEQEAIKIIKNEHCVRCDKKFPCNGCYIGIAIKALEKKVVYDQVKWERDIAIKQLEDIGLGLGEKTDVIREALEKQIPKKVVAGVICNKCPNCGELFASDWKFCFECGQKLDWTVEE